MKPNAIFAPKIIVLVIAYSFFLLLPTRCQAWLSANPTATQNSNNNAFHMSSSSADRDILTDKKGKLLVLGGTGTNEIMISLIPSTIVAISLFLYADEYLTHLQFL